MFKLSRYYFIEWVPVDILVNFKILYWYHQNGHQGDLSASFSNCLSILYITMSVVLSNLPFVLFLSDLEPICPVPYDLSYEDGLHTVKMIKEHIFRFIVEQHRKSGTVPLCLNLSSPVYKTFQRWVGLFSAFLFESFLYFYPCYTLVIELDHVNIRCKYGCQYIQI